jgi:hypothetical protein
MAVDWSYFDRFEEINEKYLPDRGEGDNVATQIVTAVNKLVYKWYNDGDVYDNTHSMDGWCNDLSSYANWLYYWSDGPVQNTLLKIFDISSESEYEDLLKELADMLLDKDYLYPASRCETKGSIYSCQGPFRFEEPNDEEDW